MSNAVRAALAVFLVGVLGVWLITPIGDACPDVGRLPAGTTSGSSPSFAPPLTRTCTYTTSEGTEAHKRYVPIVDWLIVAVVAGVVGAGFGLLGPGAPGAENAPKPARAPKPQRSPEPARAPKSARTRARSRKPQQAPRAAPPPGPAAAAAPAQTAEDRAAQRDRERLERARRRDRD
jgi:hypothetical protein